MGDFYATGTSSSTLLSKGKENLGDDHFRWKSIKRFMYLACTYSASAYNYDIFSKVCENVRLIDFILCEATVGIAYMCMDSFIKQYTRRYDCNKFMNPLLRGISYGRFLQTSLFIILHAYYLADSLKFFAVSFIEVPPWSTCRSDNSTDCVPTKDIMVRCNRNTTTDFNTTSAYFNYVNAFGVLDRDTLTMRVFVLGLVWILVFRFATVTEKTIVKIFKLTFMCRSLSTIVVLLFIVVSTNNVATEAFFQIVDISSPSEFMLSVRHVSYAYGIGFLGIHDFGAVSVFTMVDTATVIFVITFTVLAFVRSWVVKILFLMMKRCVDVDGQYGTHVLFYAMFPLTTEFLHAHKLFVIYFYGNVILASLVYMAIEIIILLPLYQFIWGRRNMSFSFTVLLVVISVVTPFLIIRMYAQNFTHATFPLFLLITCPIAHTMTTDFHTTFQTPTNLMYILAKFLSYEFRSVKQIYVVGFLCFVGFAVSIPLLALMTQIHRTMALSVGIDIAVSYLGSVYVAVVMWLYGLKKFCIDIQFWLDFKPTRFWKISWALLPVALFCFAVRGAYLLAQWEHSLMKWLAVGWASLTIFIVTAMNINSIAGFLMRNNLAGVFRSHRNYGPPEVEDRKRRLYFSEFTRQRKCKHKCLIIDEWIECSHQKLIFESTVRLSSRPSDTSLMKIYDAKTTSDVNLAPPS